MSRRRRIPRLYRCRRLLAELRSPLARFVFTALVLIAGLAGPSGPLAWPFAVAVGLTLYAFAGPYRPVARARRGKRRTR